MTELLVEGKYELIEFAHGHDLEGKCPATPAARLAHHAVLVALVEVEYVVSVADQVAVVQRELEVAHHVVHNDVRMPDLEWLEREPRRVERLVPHEELVRPAEGQLQCARHHMVHLVQCVDLYEAHAHVHTCRMRPVTHRSRSPIVVVQQATPQTLQIHAAQNLLGHGEPVRCIVVIVAFIIVSVFVAAVAVDIGFTLTIVAIVVVFSTFAICRHICGRDQ